MIICNVRAVAAAATLVALLGSAACSSKGAASDGSTGADTRTSASAGSTASRAGAAPDRLAVEGSDFSYKFSGSPHAGLVEIDFANLGEYAHELGLVQVKDGVTLAQVKAALRKGEAAAQKLQAEPGKEITSAAIIGPHVTEQVYIPLVAGHYVVTSFLPGPHHLPQVAAGMIGEFTVLEPAAAQPSPPQTAGTVELTDQAIKLPSSFSAGGTFKVTNSGTKVHDFSVAKLAGKPLLAYFQCVAGSFGNNTPIDTCPGTLQGGVTALQPGASAYLTLAFGAGQYGYVSTQGNGTDFRAGLNGTFSVK